MVMDRRGLILSGLGIGAGAAVLSAGQRPLEARSPNASSSVSFLEFRPDPNNQSNHTAALQSAIDSAAKSGRQLFIPPERYVVHGLRLSDNSHLAGIPGRSILSLKGGRPLLSGQDIANVRLDGLVLEGEGREAGDAGDANAALLELSQISELLIRACSVRNCPGNGVHLQSSAGCIADNSFADAGRAGLIVTDSERLEVLHNHFEKCGASGIEIRRSTPGYDGSIISMNRIENIGLMGKARTEGGNGIMVRNGASVTVSGNHIRHCAQSAIRAEAGSNCQITGNSCDHLGGIAIWATGNLGGALISHNLVDQAATGISVSAAGDDDAAAVIQGNFVRNLAKRGESEGIGIFVEAAAIVTGNMIDTAAFAGLLLGWGNTRNNLSASANVIRNAPIGIGISADPDAGYAAVMNNMITGSRNGAIRAMDGGKPLGPDLSRQSAESYRNMAVFANVGL